MSFPEFLESPQPLLTLNPSSHQKEGLTTEENVISNPLLPISRSHFREFHSCCLLKENAHLNEGSMSLEINAIKELLCTTSVFVTSY